LSWNKVEPEKIHRLFYPQVPVVITVEFVGRIGGMPAIWHTPLSFKPPLIGVAVAPEHNTYEMIVGAKAFGLNWLEFTNAKQVGQLGDISGKDYVDKLSAAGLATVKGEITGQPLLTTATAVLECRYSDTLRTGTHALIVGEVVAAKAQDNFNDYWDLAHYNPLLYTGTESENGKSWIFRSLRGEKTAVPFTTRT